MIIAVVAQIKTKKLQNINPSHKSGTDFNFNQQGDKTKNQVCLNITGHAIVFSSANVFAKRVEYEEPSTNAICFLNVS